MGNDRISTVVTEKNQNDFLISLIEKFIASGENQAIANKELAVQIVGLRGEMANLASKIDAFLNYAKTQPCMSGDMLKKVDELLDKYDKNINSFLEMNKLRLNEMVELEKRKTSELKNDCKNCTIDKQDKSIKSYESFYGKIVAALITLATVGAGAVILILKGVKP